MEGWKEGRLSGKSMRLWVSLKSRMSLETQRREERVGRLSLARRVE